MIHTIFLKAIGLFLTPRKIGCTNHRLILDQMSTSMGVKPLRIMWSNVKRHHANSKSTASCFR